MFNIDSQTGLINYTTVSGDAGTYTVQVTATDDDGSDTETFTITVNAVGGGNTAPTYTNTVPDSNIFEGETYVFDVDAEDAENNTLTFSLNDTTILSINPTTGLISGSYNSTSKGTYNYNVTVSDGTSTTSQTYTHTITNPAPTFLTVPNDITIFVNTTYNVDIDAEDDDVFNYSLNNSTRLTINQTGYINGSYNQTGTYTETIILTDSENDTNTATWTITVTKPITEGDTASTTLNIYLLLMLLGAALYVLPYLVRLSDNDDKAEGNTNAKYLSIAGAFIIFLLGISLYTNQSLVVQEGFTETTIGDTTTRTPTYTEISPFLSQFLKHGTTVIGLGLLLKTLTDLRRKPEPLRQFNRDTR